MAEYVRRRRPPANHPYWEFVRERARPPRTVRSIAIAAVLGMTLGVYAGLRSPYTMAQVVNTAVIVASVVALPVLSISIPATLARQGRRALRRERVMALVASIGLSLFVFLAMLIFTVLAMMWYAASAGQGPWLGTLIGGSISAGVATLLALSRRRHWFERQRQWPRWERRRRRRPSPAADAPNANHNGAGGTATTGPA